MAINEDKGILIITASHDLEPYNEAFFVDLKSFELKPSKFRFSIGPITDWKNSFQTYEQRINFLNERMQILRFENHSCEWSFFNVPYIERDTKAIRPQGADIGFDDDDEMNQKTHSDEYLYSY